jgi:hypothetical protein
MTALVWDQTGERFYQTGIDHGVLYLHDGTVAVWNGLTGVEETTNSESKSFYLDGVKYLETVVPGDFSAKLRAFTYPDEFDSVNGIADVAPGLSYYDQPAKSFNLSYRTKVGNDLDSELAYKIHLLYNVIANPDGYSFATLKDSGAEPIEFSWALSGTPQRISKFRPTAHVSIDSKKTPASTLRIIENMLYGTHIVEPSLPSIQELSEYFGGS